MTDTTHLTRRGAVYYYRARVPADLQQVYGRKMLSFSLGTTNKAEAKSLAKQHAARLDKEFSQYRGIHSPDVSSRPLNIAWTPENISQFCGAYLIHELRRDDEIRAAGLTDMHVEIDIDLYEICLTDCKKAYIKGAISETSAGGLAQELKRQNFTTPDNPEKLIALQRSFQEAQIRYYESIIRRRSGEIIHTPTSSNSGVSLKEALGYWESQAPRDPRTHKAHLQVIEKFSAQFPGISASSTKKSHIVQFKDTLLEGGLSPKTVEKYLGFLHAIFQVCTDNDKLEFNPAAGVRVPRAKVSKKSRVPFTADDLNKLFSGEIHKDGVMPRSRGGKAHYWLPLLGLFTGARLEELAQLRIEDIQELEGHGHYLWVTDEGEQQGVKNESSRRRIPIHPTLVDLGFVEYVRSVHKSNELRVFPDLEADGNGNFSGSYSKAFGRYLDKLGLSDPRLVFHSFRHGFIEACRECGIDAEHRDAITGHSQNTQAAKYGKEVYPLEPLFGAIQQVRYRGLDLSHLLQKSKQAA